MRPAVAFPCRQLEAARSRCYWYTGSTFTDPDRNLPAYPLLTSVCGSSVCVVCLADGLPAYSVYETQDTG